MGICMTANKELYAELYVRICGPHQRPAKQGRRIVIPYILPCMLFNILTDTCMYLMCLLASLRFQNVMRYAVILC